MKIEQLPTSKLIRYAKNARLHDDSQIDQICHSITEFGFNNPVLIDKRGEIIAGHGRTLAAERLGLAKVPCIRLGHLSEAQKRAYRLADNRLQETGGGWDMDLLKSELAELADLDIDLGAIGFGDDFDLGGDGNDAPEPDLCNSWEVVAECKNESEQQSVYDLMQKRGIKCRLSTF